MYPILFSIGSLNFYTFGFFVSLAFIAGFLVIYLLFKKDKKPNLDSLIDRFLIIMLSAIIISHVAYYLTYRDQFSSWLQILYFWQGGMISYGGFIGAILAYGWFYKRNLLHNLDILAIGFLIGMFFWRIGCTLTGDHPTISSNDWYAINNQMPSTLFESIGGLVGFIIASMIYLKNKLRVGLIFCLIISYYGLVRFIVDRWRLDPKIGDLTTGQLTGLVMIAIGLIALIGLKLYDRVRRKK